MSIATEIQRLQTAKANLKTTLTNKGATIPNNATLDSYSTYAQQIPIEGLIQRNITSITIPNSVTSIGNFAFYYCSSLTSVTIPNSVTSIGDDAFYYCNSLTSITIPSGVTSIGSNAFYGCFSLTSINVPNSVTSIGASAFYGCFSLTSINVPNSVTSIGASAFNSCSGLTSVTVNAATPPRLGSNAFTNTNNCPIYVPSGSVNAYKAATNWNSLASRIQAIT